MCIGLVHKEDAMLSTDARSKPGQSKGGDLHLMRVHLPQDVADG